MQSPTLPTLLIPTTLGSFDIDLEAVSAAQPDYIFLESGNIGLVKEDVTANPDYFANLKAVQDGNVYSLVSYRFYATNVDLAIANCYQVGCSVYPDQFADVDPTKKLDEITVFFLGKPLSEKTHHLLHTDHHGWKMPGEA